MADTTIDTIADKAADAVTAIKAPVAEVVETIKAEAAKPVAKARAKVAARRARKAPAKVVRAAAKVNKRAVKAARRTRKAAGVAAAPRNERNTTMAYDFTKLFAGFELPGSDRFDNLLTDSRERSEQLVAKAQKGAEQIVDLTKGNVEALVEAGKIAVAGVKSIGQDALANGRDGLERASDNAKTLAQAGTPAEFFQLQSDFARASFDRLVAEGSKLTEQLVKLAGEAAQPLQARASVNAERVNELMA